MTQRLALLALAFAALALAQNQSPTCNGAAVPLCGPGRPSGEVQIKPIAVPQSTTTVAFSDAWLKTLTITNTTSGAVTFTLSDRQASPLALFSAVSIAANTTYVVVFPEGGYYWLPGGFSVAAGGSGLIFGGAWLQ